MLFWKFGAEILRAGEMRGASLKRCLWTALFCVGFFVVIPLLIYYLSYAPQLKCEGVNNVFDMFSRERFDRVVGLQESMFKYHAGLGDDPHYFRSEWYEWPVIWWPMWYFSGADYVAEGMVSSISCMGNPAVWWTGLAALVFLLFAAAWRRRAPRAWEVAVFSLALIFNAVGAYLLNC